MRRRGFPPCFEAVLIFGDEYTRTLQILLGIDVVWRIKRLRLVSPLPARGFGNILCGHIGVNKDGHKQAEDRDRLPPEIRTPVW